ncbi:hypothetical protein BBO99_00008323 [Phytophthora kernoviae]|uniref:Uncharacterized protein n=1 Tax=Phytophthora kernoviae TaxID=325452 RepID=A0A3R7G046_9STRA|nr:hypothetical protein BBI17_009788 [Phytophthora kernoviae]RLN75436.1 hypothetical protein BBO99_00008323 [Phytophthora kernoviae]
MITRGATDHASSHNSLSSRAGTAPSDNEDPAATAAVADVVDVTGAEEPWEAVPVRRTTKPTPLRPSKRAPAKGVTGAALTEARKGKKRLVRHPAAGSAPSKKDTVDGGQGADSSAEEKAAPSAVKKAGKVPAVVKVRASETPPAPKRTTRADGGFNLDAFMASFEPGTPSADTIPHGATMPAVDSPASAHAAPMGAEMAAQLRALQVEAERLRAMVASQPHAPSPTAVAPSFVSSAPNVPNAKGEMPPGEVCYLTTASFPEGAKKGKGDYNPPQAHLLAASRMFRGLGTETGKTLSAMSFVLWIGCLGSRGLTLMHFKESSEMASLEDGSTNANFSSDFSPSASLPPATIRCATNKSADPGNTLARVRLTLLYANKLIGATLGHLQADDPQWWSGLSEALRGIYRDSGRRETARRPGIPDAIRCLIPINRKGQEPCLLNVAGLPCSGGSRQRCGNARRVHDWPERLPSRLLEWIERTYGGRQAQHEDRR